MSISTAFYRQLNPSALFRVLAILSALGFILDATVGSAQSSSAQLSSAQLSSAQSSSAQLSSAQLSPSLVQSVSVQLGSHPKNSFCTLFSV